MVQNNGPLCLISSGRQASEGVAHDMITAHETGKDRPISNTAVRKKIVKPTKTLDLLGEVLRVMLRQVAKGLNEQLCIHGEKHQGANICHVVYNTRELFHKMLVIDSERGLDIRKVLEYSSGTLPYSLATEHVGLVKTTKPTFMYVLEKLV